VDKCGKEIRILQMRINELEIEKLEREEEDNKEERTGLADHVHSSRTIVQLIFFFVII
jgi:hypothetical protein